LCDDSLLVSISRPHGLGLLINNDCANGGVALTLPCGLASPAQQERD